MANAAALFSAPADRLWLVCRLARWRRWRSIVHRLVNQGRERAGREASPSLAHIRDQIAALMIGIQSVKTTDRGGPHGGACPWDGRRPHPRDAGKKALGRNRHAMVDTDGRPLVLQVHPASVDDRDGAAPWLAAPFVEICSTTTNMECDSSISGPPAPIGPTSPCSRPGRKRTALARSGRLFACRVTVLDLPPARRLLVSRQ